MTKKSATLLLMVTLLLLAAVPSAFAFEGISENNYTLAAGETVNDNLFVGGTTVTIDGTVNGDVFAGATTVIVNGTINGDLFALAQEIVINGTVEDVRVGGMRVALSEGATITGDLMAGGASVETADGSLISGDALLAGQQALLEGDISNDLQIGAGSVTLNGDIDGNVNASVGGAEDQPPFDPTMFNPEAPDMATVAPGLTFGENADIAGDFALESTADYLIPEGQVGGESTFNKMVTDTAGEEISTSQKTVSRLWLLVQRWLVLVVIGFLALRFAPRWIKSPSHNVETQLGGSVGWGALILFIFPIVAVIAIFILIAVALIFSAIKLGGIGGALAGLGLLALGVLGLTFLLIAQFIAPLAVGHRVGKLIFGENSNPILPLAVGTLIIILLMAIPFVGGLINLVVTILGLGAAWLWLRNRGDSHDDMDRDYLDRPLDNGSLLEPI